MSRRGLSTAIVQRTDTVAIQPDEVRGAPIHAPDRRGRSDSGRGWSNLRNQAATKRSTAIFPARSRACRRSYAICIPSQVSGVEPNAFESRIAMSAEIPVRPFTSSESAWRVTPIACRLTIEPLLPAAARSTGHPPREPLHRIATPSPTGRAARRLTIMHSRSIDIRDRGLHSMVRRYGFAPAPAPSRRVCRGIMQRRH